MGRPKKPVVKDLVPKKHGHRPPIKIDWVLVDEFLEAGCSGVQISGHYGMSDSYFYNVFKKVKGVRFQEYSLYKKSRGEALLQLKQFKQALGTCTKKINTPLLLRLGETRLGQSKNGSENKSDGMVAVQHGIKGLSQDAGSETAQQPELAAE